MRSPTFDAYQKFFFRICLLVHKIYLLKFMFNLSVKMRPVGLNVCEVRQETETIEKQLL